MQNRAGCFEAFSGNRRRFMQTVLLGAGAVGAGLTTGSATAADPPQRIGKPHMKLSLSAYSFRRSLPRSWTPEQLKHAKMALEDFIHFCAELDLDGCEPTAYYFPKDVTHEYLMHLKELTFRLGLDVSGTAIGNNFGVREGEAMDEQLAMTRRWIDHAAVLGAPVIRIFAGRVPKGDTEEATIKRCIAGIDKSLDYAATKGVFLALENHGGITSTPEQMLKIIKGVKASPWFGVNFDSGNFQTDDPYADLERIAPYTINAQVKTRISPNRKEEKADLGRIIKILKDVNYRGYVVLEYEADEEPKKAIPRHIRELRDLIQA